MQGAHFITAHIQFQISMFPAWRLNCCFLCRVSDILPFFLYFFFPPLSPFNFVLPITVIQFKWHWNHHKGVRALGGHKERGRQAAENGIQMFPEELLQRHDGILSLDRYAVSNEWHFIPVWKWKLKHTEHSVLFYFYPQTQVGIGCVTNGCACFFLDKCVFVCILWAILRNSQHFMFVGVITWCGLAAQLNNTWALCV